MISAGMVDIVMEDMNGNVFHIEEQRNMSEEDLCRFAVYHFSASRDWNYKIHDIILISGTSYNIRAKEKSKHPMERIVQYLLILHKKMVSNV
jgi:hypothetical protein